jgi:hypothetical protein
MGTVVGFQVDGANHGAARNDFRQPALLFLHRVPCLRIRPDVASRMADIDEAASRRTRRV